MKRGLRPIWRDVATAAQKVADSRNYAEEYMYGIEFRRALDSLFTAALGFEAEACGVSTVGRADEPAAGDTDGGAR